MNRFALLPTLVSLLSLAVCRSGAAAPPLPADIVFSSRFGPNAAQDLEKAEAFNATYISWHYLSSSPSSSAQVFQNEGMSVQCTLNSHTTVDEQSCRKRNNNNFVLVSHLPGSNTRFADVNAAARTTFIDAQVSAIIAAGCTSVQYDDPLANIAPAAYLSDNLEDQGCYGTESIQKFSQFLAAPGTGFKADRGDYPTNSNLPAMADFNYVAFLNGAYGQYDDLTKNIFKDKFLAFQEKSTRDYLTQLKTTLNNAGIDLQGNTALDPYFSGRIHDKMDGINTEVKEKFTDFFSLTQLVSQAKFLGKPVILNPVPDQINATTNTAMFRRVILAAYALGEHAVMPYDIFVPGATTRYYGIPSDYADITEFIKANTHLFNNYTIRQFRGHKETATITAIDQHKDVSTWRTIIHNKRESFKQIAANQEVIINGQHYWTKAPSGEGFIHLDAADITSGGIAVNQPVQRIKDGAQRGVTFTREFTTKPYITLLRPVPAGEGSSTELEFALSTGEMHYRRNQDPVYHGGIYAMVGGQTVPFRGTGSSNGAGGKLIVNTVPLVNHGYSASAASWGLETPIDFLRDDRNSIDFINEDSRKPVVQQVVYRHRTDNVTTVVLDRPVGYGGNVPALTDVAFPGWAGKTTQASPLGQLDLEGDLTKRIKIGDPLTMAGQDAPAPTWEAQATVNVTNRPANLLVTWGAATTGAGLHVIHFVHEKEPVAAGTPLTVSVDLPSPQLAGSVRLYSLNGSTTVQPLTQVDRTVTFQVPTGKQWTIAVLLPGNP